MSAKTEKDPENSFDGGYHIWAKERYKRRVSKNPARITFAIKQFEENNIKYILKNERIGHFHCWRKSDDKLYQFWAGTGKILGFENIRGIKSLIEILTE